jgi:hypothetical protein
MNPDTIIALLPKHSLDAPAVACDGARVSLTYSVESLPRVSSDTEALRAQYAISDASQEDLAVRSTDKVRSVVRLDGARVDLTLSPKPAKASAPKGG